MYFTHLVDDEGCWYRARAKELVSQFAGTALVPCAVGVHLQAEPNASTCGRPTLVRVLSWASDPQERRV